MEPDLYGLHPLHNHAMSKSKGFSGALNPILPEGFKKPPNSFLLASWTPQSGVCFFAYLEFTSCTDMEGHSPYSESL